MAHSLAVRISDVPALQIVKHHEITWWEVIPFLICFNCLNFIKSGAGAGWVLNASLTLANLPFNSRPQAWSTGEQLAAI